MQRQGDCICTPRELETEEMFQGKKRLYKLTCDLDEFVELAKGEPSHLVRAFVEVAFFVIVETLHGWHSDVFRLPGIVASHSCRTRQWYH